jgi:hypothetical protein
MRALLPFAMISVLGCQSSGAGPASVDHSFKDQGRVCAFPEGIDPGNAFLPADSVSFQADRTATITVMAPTCLSSSCSKDATAACTATVSGNVIQVASTASFRQNVEGACTDDCGALVAHCTTPPLPAGTYFLRHGADQAVITVPSTGSAPCAGKAP